MKKIRQYVSCITNEQCKSFREASISVQPVNRSVHQGLNIDDKIEIGSTAMNEDGFIMIKGIKDV